MPRPKPIEKLLPITFRFPISFVESLKKEALTKGETVSDTVRRHISSDAVKLTEYSVKRPKCLKPPSNIDPDYLFQLTQIGNNVNQIARAINYNGHILPMPAVNMLAVLSDMKDRLMKLGDPKCI